MPKTPEELEKELAAASAREAELQKALENYKANAGSDDALKKRLEDLEKQNAEMAAKNRQMEINSAKQEAIKKYPYANAFIDKISVEKPEEIEIRAKEFHEATVAARDAAIKEKETELAARFGQLPAGSPPGVMRKEELEAEYEKAKKENNIFGMLKAKMINHLQNTASK